MMAGILNRIPREKIVFYPLPISLSDRRISRETPLPGDFSLPPFRIIFPRRKKTKNKHVCLCGDIVSLRKTR